MTRETASPDRTVRPVLLSIDPEWAAAILAGRKQWEYRRTPPAQTPPYPSVLYATQPVGAVVGQARIGGVEDRAIDALVARTVEETPHAPEDVFDYFEDCRTGTALQITAARRFPRPVGLDEFGIDHAPQNFQYLGGTA